MDPVKDISLQHALRFQENTRSEVLYSNEQIIDIAKSFYNYLTESNEKLTAEDIKKLYESDKCKCEKTKSEDEIASKYGDCS